MAKDAKYAFFKNHKETKELAREIWYNLENKYFDIWMSKFRIKELRDEANYYLFKRYYEQGNIACWNIKHTDELGLAGFAPSENKSMYGTISSLTLDNKYNASDKVIPSREMIVGKDVVIGYAQHNHKSVKSTIYYYISRIAEVELLINNNLMLHKMPYMITVDSDNEKKRLTDIVEKILNDEQIIYASTADLNSLQAISLNVPFIIDKLKDYQRTVEMELLMQLGIDTNSSKALEKTNVSVEAINCNNNYINHWHNVYKQELTEFIDRIEEVLGKKLTLIDLNDEMDTSFTDSVHTEYQSNKLLEGEQKDEK